MDKETLRKKKIYMAKTLLISFLLTFLIINLLLNYLMLFFQYAGVNARKYNTTPSTVSEEAVDMSFKMSYLYFVEGFDIKMVIICSFGIAMLISYKLSEYWQVRHANKNIKGDSRWATEKDIRTFKGIYCIEDENHLEKAEESGIILAKFGKRLYCDSSTTHSLIIGTTRSGKGQTFVLPKLRTIAMSKTKHSLVVNDPKGEICEYLYQILIDNGYKVVILNLSDTNHTSLWDPLFYIKKEYTAQMDSGSPDLSETSDMIASLTLLFTENPKSDPIWPESAQALFTAMIFYLLEDGYKRDKILNNGTTPNMDKVTLYSVYQFFITFGTINRVKIVKGAKKYVNAMEELFDALPIGNPARSAFATAKFASGEMLSSIEGTLSSNLKLFGSDQGIAKLTSGNQINFSDLIDPEKPCAIFMIVPDEKVTRHRLASLFINQCYEVLCAESRKYKDNRLPQRVIFELDEFGNMVRIPGMDNKITVSAGRNLLFSIYCQDLNQIDSKYSDEAKTIRSNCGNVVYIMSNDKDTNDYMSALLGNETLEYRTYSGNFGEWLNHQNTAVDGKSLLTGDQLSRLDEGTAVIKRMRCLPIKTKFDYFYKLGIKRVPVGDIPIDIIDVDLNDLIYDFEPIGNEIGLVKYNDTLIDKEEAQEKINEEQERALAKEQEEKAKREQQAAAEEQFEVDDADNEAIASSMQNIPVGNETSASENEPTLPTLIYELVQHIDKMYYNDDTLMSAFNDKDVQRAMKIINLQYKGKKHISKDEYNILSEYIKNDFE